MLAGECMRVHFPFSSKNPFVQKMDGITSLHTANFLFLFLMCDISLFILSGTQCFGFFL